MSSVLSNTPGVTASRFLRLFALSFTLMLGYGPVAILVLAQNISIPKHQYSWSFIHPPDWSERIISKSGPKRLSLDRWAQIATGYVFFLFFGLGKEATQLYKSWFEMLRRFSPTWSHLSGRSPSALTGNTQP